jgi:hypothetical protein
MLFTKYYLDKIKKIYEVRDKARLEKLRNAYKIFAGKSKRNR